MPAIGTSAPVSPVRERQDVAAVIEAARRDVESAPEVYRPGEFWDQLIDQNLEMLRTHGVATFKRTVSNNYYNWLVTSLRDPQIQRAVRRWLQRPSLAPLLNRLESNRPTCARPTAQTPTRSRSPRAGATSASSGRRGRRPATKTLWGSRRGSLSRSSATRYASATAAV